MGTNDIIEIHNKCTTQETQRNLGKQLIQSYINDI